MAISSLLSEPPTPDTTSNQQNVPSSANTPPTSPQHEETSVQSSSANRSPTPTQPEPLRVQLSSGAKLLFPHMRPSPTHWCDDVHGRALIELWDRMQTNIDEKSMRPSQFLETLSYRLRRLHPKLAAGMTMVTGIWVALVLDEWGNIAEFYDTDDAFDTVEGYLLSKGFVRFEE
ncbi:hypothetical protein CERZMDRAFT_101830 [Cercospora zeae-maydis SCOH1-5]|uniref:Uncharacterized protein n=1 Tax=Cercospora zeae-maydis SCOH1-5 TaxID=717836 RepID=A0A6A6F0I5_9PEZI|nr:hypothetical protein CERZMDRAFT_101830 [Cercospora zeae-maydis SCOH1-5]